MKELVTRSISGLIYAGLMIGSVTIHPLLFFALFALILVAGMTEFYRLTSDTAVKPFKLTGILTGFIFFSVAFLIHYAGFDSRWVLVGIPALLILLAIPMFYPDRHPALSAGFTLLGLVYVALPVTLFNGLVYHPYKDTFDYQVVIFLFAVLWINDTGAYLTGILIGRHKIFPRVSPKKSWEGLAGGLVLASLGTWILLPLFPSIPAGHLWILLPVIVLTGTLGDFAESAWKRSAGVKDSGKIMPGHGGVLDRFDSLIFAAPAVYLTIRLLNLVP